MTTDNMIRWAKILLVGVYGLYMAVVVVGNVTDYDSNFQFVSHVLSMDTIFEDSSLRRRAVTSPLAHHLAYLFIIGLELFIAVACVTGAVQMIRAVRLDADDFHGAKRWAVAGLMGGIGLWFFGFQVVGGEWFAMWQSETWNGLDAAFRLATFTGIVLLAMFMREG